MSAPAARYFIAIIPPDEIASRARLWQQEFSEKFGAKASLRSPPHITLHMPFMWKESREQELIDELSIHFKAQTRFQIALDGVGAFSPRVIYINVNASSALVGCQRNLTRFCRIKFDIHNSDYGDMPYHPHLTLAFRDLRKADFNQAWQEFGAREFKSDFTLQAISLLKHTGKEWLSHKEMPLRNE